MSQKPSSKTSDPVSDLLSDSVSPDAPTGRYVTPDTLTDLVDLCRNASRQSGDIGKLADSILARLGY